jgi:hypothetical protein
MTPPEKSDRDVISRFRRALGQEEYDLLPGDARRLTEIAVEWANEKASTDPRPG